MHIDTETFKRLTSRIALMEEQSEVNCEIIAALIRCCKALAARIQRPAGSPDPFELIMMDPIHHKPYVLPPGLAEELDNPIHKWAIGKLPQEEADEFHRRTRIMWRMREMREERESRNRVSCVSKKSPGGGAPGATDFTR